MPEKERINKSPQDLFGEKPESGRSEKHDKQRLGTLRLVMRIGAVAALAALVLNLDLYFQTGAWQMLAVGGCQVLSIACLVWVARLTSQGRLESASYWTLSVMVLALALIELFHSGLTLYLLVGGILLILIAGYLLLPRKWWLWLGLAAIYTIYSLLVNWLQPLPRYDITQLVSSSDAFVIALVVFVAGAFIWGLAYAFRRLVAIRTRLLTAFVAVALVPAVTITTVSILLGTRDAQSRVVNQLESVAALKEAEIQASLDDLQKDLMAALSNRDVFVDARFLLEVDPNDLIRQSNVRVQLRSELEGFDELFLIDAQGHGILSSERSERSMEGRDLGEETLFLAGLQGPSAQIRADFPLPGETSVVVARPIPNLSGERIGVIAGHTTLGNLNDLMQVRAGLGETGETYLVDSELILLTDSRFSGFPTGEAQIRTEATSAALQDHASGSGTYAGYRDVPVIGVYHWLPDLQIALLAEQEQSEALRATFSTLGLNLGVTIVSALVAIGVGLLVTQGIANPLASLTETAGQIAAGDLALEAKVEREDEVGKLAHAFNSMTAQLRGLIGTLEQRVAERTHDLERRTAYMEASAEVGYAASSILDTDTIIRQAVELIGQRFGLYYVGLFEVGESGQWAVLRAGTGEAGQAMLARGYRIRVGEGTIGRSIADAQACLASTAEADTMRPTTPELPETRAEAALPLRSRGQVIGALSVQATEPDAFGQDTLVFLQTMADQLAVAIDNARLFAASQQALEAERRAYGEISKEAWTRIVHSQVASGFRADEHGVTPIAGGLLPEVQPAVRQGQVVPAGDGQGPVMAVPIPVRDQVIGTLRFRKPGEEAWTQDEITLLEDMAAQLGQALESARLYRDTQRRAAREEMFGEMTARIRETLDMESVLRTAAQEVRQALGLPEVVIRLANRPPDGGQSGME